MSYKCPFITAVGILLFLSSYCQAECPKGFQTWHTSHDAVCLSDHMVAYLTCLESTGSGLITVEKDGSNAASTQVKVGVEGGGSGLVVKGKGKVSVDTKKENVAINKIRQQFDPKNSTNCFQGAFGATTLSSNSVPLSKAKHQSANSGKGPQGVGKRSLSEQKSKSVIIPGTSIKFGMTQSEFKNQLKRLRTECEWYTNKKGYLVCKYEETYRGLPSVAEHYFSNGVLSESHFLSYIEWRVDHVGNYTFPGRNESHGETGDKDKAGKYCQTSVLNSLVSDLIESFGPTIKPPEQTRDNLNNARWKQDCEGRDKPSCRATATLEKNKYIFNAASEARLVFQNEHYTAGSDRDIQYYDPIKFTGTNHREDNTCRYEFIFLPL